MEVQDIMKAQGTRLNKDLPPWMTYAAEMGKDVDVESDPQLEKEIEQYSQKKHQKTSAQNEDEFLKQKELNDEIAKQYNWLPEFEYENDACRIGKILTHAEFINLLRDSCNLKCYYTQHPQDRKLTLLVEWKGKLEVGCWAQWGQMPEFSMCRFDDHGTIIDEKFRGWRTCLLQLILKGFLTEETVTKVFGEAIGPASKRYNSLLYEWRNRDVEVV